LSTSRVESCKLKLTKTEKDKMFQLEPNKVPEIKNGVSYIQTKKIQ